MEGESKYTTLMVACGGEWRGRRVIDCGGFVVIKGAAIGPPRLGHYQLSLSHGQIPWPNPVVETDGHTHQLLIFEHKHMITKSKFEKKQAPRERKRESWI